jgi:peptidoglycan/xylan/chitin deacetylase (PgdA/CDA1 family)
MCTERFVLSMNRSGASRSSHILCYHSVGTPQMGVNDVSPRRFRAQIEAALADGFTFVPASELAIDADHGNRLAITFDDGFRSVATNAAPILAEYGIPWTVFVVGEWAEGRHPTTPQLFLDWDEITTLARSGVTIGSHSMTHPDFGRITGQNVVDELAGVRQRIAQRTGIDATEFAIPFGQSKNWSGSASRAAASAGYTLVYAQSDLRRPIGTVPRTFVTRFDSRRNFRAALRGAFANWEEWF